MEDDVYDDETIDNENDEEENFQIHPAEEEKNYISVNTRIDYQHILFLVEKSPVNINCSLSRREESCKHKLSACLSAGSKEHKC